RADGNDHRDAAGDRAHQGGDGVADGLEHADIDQNDARASAGSNPACTTRAPMPEPAWAAAPNGRLTRYTTRVYTAISPNSAPAENPISSSRDQSAGRGRQSPRESCR